MRKEEMVLRKGTLSVLVVEDETRLRELLADVIPDMGFTVTTARSAEEARRVMVEEPHDIVMLDLQLPVRDGMDLFEEIRRDWPQAQVIVLTGYGNLEVARRAIRLDVVDFLTKPCPLHDIELALDRARRRVGGKAEQSVPVGTPVSLASDAPSTLADAERVQIMTALTRNNGNRTATAAELGISRRTLHYRLSEYSRNKMNNEQ